MVSNFLSSKKIFVKERKKIKYEKANLFDCKFGNHGYGDDFVF